MRKWFSAVTQIHADMLFIVVFVLALLLLVASLVTIFTVLRRARHPYNAHPVLEANLWASLHAPRTPPPPAPRSIPAVSALPPPRLKPTITTDTITIHIEPDGMPTNEQENIRRLIKHLEKMPKKAAS